MPLDTDTKAAFHGLERMLVDMRAKHDQDLREIKRGRADIVTKNELARIEKAVDEAKSKVNDLARKANRPAIVLEGTPTQQARERKCLEEFGRVYMGGVSDIAQIQSAHRQYRAVEGKYVRAGLEAMTDLEKKTLVADNGPNGGFWIEPQRSDVILTRMYETSALRELATVQSITTSRIEFPVQRDKGLGRWVGQTTTRIDTTTPQIGMLAIQVHEVQAQPRVTTNMLDDTSYDVEAFLNEDIARVFSLMENSAFVLGDGVIMPRGFLTVPTSTADDTTRPLGTIQELRTGVNGGFAATAPADKLLDLIYAFKPQYRAGLRWGMNRVTLGQVRKFKNAYGDYIAGMRLTDNGVIEQVFEYGVSEFADMPTPAAGSLSIALAQWKRAYIIVDRQGIRQLRDPFTAKPFVIFDTTKRVGGDVWDTEAIKLLRFGT